MMFNFFRRSRLFRIEGLLVQLNEEIRKMATQLDALRAQVERNSSVTDSAVTLLNGLKAKLDEAIASGDPTALQALSDQLGTETDKLAEAVSANTPSA